MLTAAEKYLPAIDGADIDDVFIGWRPLPLDGHPVLGVNPERPDVYLAVNSPIDPTTFLATGPASLGTLQTFGMIE